MAEGIYSWSKTPSENDAADDNVNWLEGQDPSTVNNSSRQEMAEVAGFRDDIGAAALSTGTEPAYEVSSADIVGTPDHKTINVLAVGNVLWFRVHATNDGGTSTLDVNGLGTVPLRGVAGIELEAGTLVAGQVVGVFYDGTQWLIVGATYGTISRDQLSDDLKSQLVQVGFVRPKFTTGDEPGWLTLDGTIYNVADYPVLGALYGDRYGGDGVLTFGVPLASGMFLRQIDAGSGNDPEAATRTPAVGVGALATEVGSTQGDETGAHDHTTTEPNSGQGHQHSFQANKGTAQVSGSFGTSQPRAPGSSGLITELAKADITVDPTTGAETRPKNMYTDWVVLADLAQAGGSAGPFVVILDGAGPPADSFGNNGDFYVDNTNTTWYGPKTGGTWGAGVELIGPTGANGANGAAGQTGLPYQFDTDQTMDVDPGDGNVRISATGDQVNFSKTNADTANVAALLLTWDDANNPTGKKARLTIEVATGAGIFQSFFIDDLDIDDAEFVQFNTTPIDASGTFGIQAVNCAQVTFGDKGDLGATGPTGPQGPTLGLIYDWVGGGTGVPSAGQITSNNGDETSTILTIHETDKEGINQSLIHDWLGSSTTIASKSTIILVDPGATGTRVEWIVTDYTPGTGDGSGVSTFTVTPAASGGTWGAGTFDVAMTTLGITGDKGTDGAGGDVFGDAVSTVAGEIAVYTDTTGKRIDGSGGALLSDFMKATPGPVTDDNLAAYDGTGGGQLQEIPLTGTQAVADSAKLAGIASGAEVNTVDSVNGDTGAVVLTTDDIADSASNRYTNDTDINKLAGIDAGAEVNDPNTVLDNTVNTFTAGQRKQITTLIATTNVYNWAAESLDNSNDFDLGAAFNVARTLNIPPDLFAANESQAGEITGITSIAGSLIFGAGWQFPDGGVVPTIGGGVNFTLYYRSYTLNGSTQINRIVDIQGWI